MPSRRYQRYDRDDESDYAQSNSGRNDRYGEVRSYRRDRDRDVQDVSYSEMDNIRQQGLASYDSRRGQGDMSVVRRSQTRDVNGDSRQSYEQRVTRRGYSSDDDDRNYYRSRRRDSAPDYGRADRRRQGQYRNDREQQSQANGQDQQVAPYQRQRGQDQQQQQPQRQQQNSRQGEEEGDFFSRNFDTGADGLITALAGGALGAITARHLTAQNHFAQTQDTTQSRMRRNWRTIAGAVAGAAALNVAESRLKDYFEEEHKEHMQDGGEFVGEVLGAVGPDVI